MAPAPPDQLAESARSAVARCDWAAARTAFEQLVDQQPTGEALAGLGDALWWLGETTDSVERHSRAYAAFQHRGDPAGATMTAINLYFTHRVSLGNTPVARGWLARAARLVEEHQIAPLGGWVALLRAHDSADPETAARFAGSARRTAREFHDPDLELCGISQSGAALVRQGRLAEGTRLLDEAAAAALAGEARRPHTTVFTCCNLIQSCTGAGEVEHIVRWTRAFDEFERRCRSPHLYTTCRTCLGSVYFATGAWARAEQELRAALELGGAAEPDVTGEAAGLLAELRLAQGRIEDAERLLAGLPDHPSCELAGAAVALAHGDRVTARSLAARVTSTSGAPGEQDGPDADGPLGGRYRPGLSAPVEEARAWEVLLDAGSDDEGAAALRHLDRLASTSRCRQIRARTLRASGRLHRDAADLRRALRLFLELGFVREAARTRMLLADLLPRDEAVVEARDALAAFDRLGALPEADAAAARLRELGVVPARIGSAGEGSLTRREREVLALVGEGLTNREIGERLFLSRKTVERHVRNVLLKLGLRNRTEAATHLLRHPEETRSTN